MGKSLGNLPPTTPGHFPYWETGSCVAAYGQGRRVRLAACVRILRLMSGESWLGCLSRGCRAASMREDSHIYILLCFHITPSPNNYTKGALHTQEDPTATIVGPSGSGQHLRALRMRYHLFFLVAESVQEDDSVVICQYIHHHT